MAVAIAIVGELELPNVGTSGRHQADVIGVRGLRRCFCRSSSFGAFFHKISMPIFFTKTLCPFINQMFLTFLKIYFLVYLTGECNKQTEKEGNVAVKDPETGRYGPVCDEGWNILKV